ncbi:MAG: outer membrane beta-barrel protein [Bacteroidota bacterium]
MKKYFLISMIALFAVFLTSTADAQMETHWDLQWNISVPASDFKEFIDETSVRGIEFGGSYHFETNVTLGAAIGYGAFFKKTGRLTVNYENNTLTSIHFRDLYSYYFLAEGGYAYQSDFFMTPYARVGIGAFYTEQITQLGLLYWKDESWDFGIRPELGVLIEVPDSGVGFIVNAKYNTVFNYGNDLENLNYLAFGLGFIFGF